MSNINGMPKTHFFVIYKLSINTISSLNNYPTNVSCGMCIIVESIKTWMAASFQLTLTEGGPSTHVELMTHLFIGVVYSTVTDVWYVRQVR